VYINELKNNINAIKTRLKVLIKFYWNDAHPVTAHKLIRLISAFCNCAENTSVYNLHRFRQDCRFNDKKNVLYIKILIMVASWIYKTKKKTKHKIKFNVFL
jgi:uncharacterized protein YcfL